jgi:hypothetical protein
MTDVLNGVSHFLGICVGIVIILLVIGYTLQSSTPTSKPSTPKKKNHYHLVYNSNKSNTDSSTQSNSIETYKPSSVFSSNSSIY